VGDLNVTFDKFDITHLKTISEILADAVTHDDLTRLFAQCCIAEPPYGTPDQPAKWRRILITLAARQDNDRCGNNVAAFIEAVANPVRYIHKPKPFEEYRHRLNVILILAGLTLSEDGEFRLVAPAKTLSEAEERACRLRHELKRRNVHADVLIYCHPELLRENYFHAILEATKSVADKIRARTGLTLDGAALVDTAFRLNQPLLALNSLRTDSEQSEQKGFANMLKGVFGMFRNPTAHDPRIRRSYSEPDAIDLLTHVSFLHRQIDASIRTPYSP
jgi:uncharacterized protein (TIGR02391 family)